MKKLLISVVVIVVIAVSGWLGASIYVGRTAATIIASLSAKAGQNAAIRLAEVNHKQGLLSSTGQFEIRFNEVAVDAKSGNQMFALQVNYSVENLLLPSSSMRFQWANLKNWCRQHYNFNDINLKRKAIYDGSKQGIYFIDSSG